MTRRNIAAAAALVLSAVVLSGCAVTYPADPAASHDSTYEVVVPTTAPDPTPSTPAQTSADPVERPIVDAAGAIDLLSIPYEVDTLRLPVDVPVTITAGGDTIYAEDSTVGVTGSGTTELTVTLDQATADQHAGYVFVSTNGGASRALNLEASE